MKKLFSSVFSLLTMTCFTHTANAQPTDLSEKISEETTKWGKHTVISDVFTEQFDPTTLPKSKQDSVGAIRAVDKMYGLVFRVNGELPENVDTFNIHYFQDYFPYDQAKYDAFSSDNNGCFVASYNYYQDYLKYRFSDSTNDEPVTITFVDGSNVELANLDSVVILMMEYPTNVQSEIETEEAYFLKMEQSFLSCGHFSYLGEARRIEQTYYYNLDGLDIVCKNADAAKDLLNSELLSDYSPKKISKSDPCKIMLPELLTIEARELRECVRNDSRVVDAQIAYSHVAETGTDFVSAGIFMNVAFGDLNNDGKLSIADAVLLARVVAEDETLKSNKVISAVTDYDQNGVIDAEDITALLKTISST